MVFVKILFSIFTILAFFASCSPDDEDESIIFNFTNDLDGWSSGFSGKQLDSVTWISWGGMPPGCVKLDGSDFGTSDHHPNSWIYKEIDLPDEISSLSFITSAQNRADGNGKLRVRLIDENQNSNVLMDWEVAYGVEEVLDWSTKSIDISTFSGQTVVLFF